jgi:hypothetical protein
MNEGTPRTDAFLSAPASDIFAHNPGHSDLDDEQPIHITVPLGDWRRLDLALRSV